MARHAVERSAREDIVADMVTCLVGLSMPMTVGCIGNCLRTCGKERAFASSCCW